MEISIAAKVFFSSIILLIPTVGAYLQENKKLSRLGGQASLVLVGVAILAMLKGLWSL